MRNVGFERDERFAFIIGGPPRALRNSGSLRGNASEYVMPRSPVRTHSAEDGALICSTGTPRRAISRPRSIGAVEIRAPGAFAIQKILERRKLAFRYPDKEVAWRAIRQARLEFIRQRGIDKRHRREKREPCAERKRDRARETCGAADIGERQRHLGPLRALQRCRKPADASARAPEQDEDRKETSAGESGDPVLPGEGHGEQRQQRHNQERRYPIERGGRRRSSPPLAEQFSRAHLLRPPQGPEDEGKRRQQPEQSRERQSLALQARLDRDWHETGQQACDQPGHSRRNRKADQDAEERKKADLYKEDAKDDALGRAERLEGGDGHAASFDEGRNRVRHADAARQHRRQADQRQKFGQPLERAFHAGDGSELSRTRKPASGNLVGEVFSEIGWSAGPRLDAVGPADEAAGLDKAGLFQRIG